MKIIRNILMALGCMILNVAATHVYNQRAGSIPGRPVRVFVVYVDQEGVKWFGTDQGLYRYDNISWNVYTEEDYLAGNQVHAIAQETTETGSLMWLATSGGVSLISVDPGGVTGAASYTSQDGLLDDSIVDIAIDSRQGLFFGSEGGITLYSEGVMIPITYEQYYQNMLSTPVRQLDIYGDTLYVAQEGGIGRFISGVDGISGPSRWTSEYGMTPFSGDIRSVMVEGVDQQWFGTDLGVELHTGYLAKENWSLFSTGDGLVNNEVIAIRSDPDGGIWFGTTGGVSHLKDENWSTYTQTEGLVNDTVYDIAFDPDGSVWFATAGGISKLYDGAFTGYLTSVEDPVLHSESALTVSSNKGIIHLVYHLDRPSRVSARLFSLDGKLVQTWQGLPGQAGSNRTELSPAEGFLQQGIYLLHLDLGRRVEASRLVILH